MSRLRRGREEASPLPRSWQAVVWCREGRCGKTSERAQSAKESTPRLWAVSKTNKQINKQRHRKGKGSVVFFQVRSQKLQQVACRG